MAAVTTAWKFPGTVVNGVSGETGSNDWTGPANITADDGSEASSAFAGTRTRTLRASNFGFTSSDIPAGATINGIEVRIERRESDADRVSDVSLFIVPDGSSGNVSGRVGNNKADTATKWPTSAAVATYGSSSDNWATGLTRAQALSSNFAVDFEAQSVLGGVGYVDYLQARLTWELPSISGAADITEAPDSSTGGSAYLPALDLDFIPNETPDARIAFSGGANGTRIDSTGRLSYVPCNLLARSQEFDDAAWTKNSVTVTAEATTAPNGTTTADKLIEAAANTYHYLQQNSGVTGRYEVISVYAKPAGRNWVALQLGGSTNLAWFNVATGALGSIVGSGTATIEAADNGFYRCSLKALRSGSSANLIYVASADSVASYAGDGVSGLYIWGAQVEPVSHDTKARSYLMSTTAAYYGPRFDYNPVTLEALGLLSEEARTNYLVDSEFAAGLPAARGGSVTAVPFVGLTAGTGISVQNANPTTSYFYVTNYAVPASSPRVISVFVRMDDGGAPAFGATANQSPLNDFVFNLGGAVFPPHPANGGKVEDYGGGLYRVSLAVTTIASPNTSCGVIKYPGNSARGFTASGLMVEAGAGPTSYIVTGATEVTRTASSAIVSGGDFSGFFNPSAGTFIVDFDRLDPLDSTDRMVIQVDDGTATNRLDMYVRTTGRAFGRASSVTSFDFSNLGAMAAGTRQKMALAFADNDFAASMNGNVPTADASGAVPAVNQLLLGSGHVGSPLNGHVRWVRYFNQRLPNAVLQTLTTLITGTGALTEANDTVVSTGRVKVQGQAAIVEGDDVAAGAGETGIHLVTPPGRIAIAPVSRLSNRIAR